MKNNSLHTAFVACLDNLWISKGGTKRGYKIQRFRTPSPMTIEDATALWLRHDITSQIIFVVPAENWLGDTDQLSMNLIANLISIS